jgi:hypothetical protein
MYGSEIENSPRTINGGKCSNHRRDMPEKKTANEVGQFCEIFGGYDEGNNK